MEAAILSKWLPISVLRKILTPKYIVSNMPLFDGDVSLAR